MERTQLGRYTYLMEKPSSKCLNWVGFAMGLILCIAGILAALGLAGVDLKEFFGDVIAKDSWGLWTISSVGLVAGAILLIYNFKKIGINHDITNEDIDGMDLEPAAPIQFLTAPDGAKHNDEVIIQGIICQVRDVGESPFTKHLIVLPSARKAGHSRLVLGNPGSHSMSSERFTYAQLDKMIQFATSPPEGYRISGLTNYLRPKSGLIVFTKQEGQNKTFYQLDEEGNLSRVSINRLIGLVKHLQTLSFDYLKLGNGR